MEPHSGPIRWGIAATGKIAGQFAEAFSALDPRDDAAIVAVGSRAQASAERFAAAHGIDRAHGSYAALADDPDVDVVYVASLQPGHMADAITMLEAGKHVLIEKPMTLSAAQADRVFDAARAADRFVMEAMWMRFNPAPVDAVRRIEAGEIGTVEHMDIDFSIAVADDPEHRLRSRAKGGGSLLDLGIYPLTLAWWIAGPPASIAVTGEVAAGVDTRCVIEAEWDNGVTARLSSGLDEAGSCSATIRGTEATLTIPAPFHAGDHFTIEDRVHRLAPASLHHQVVEVHRCLQAGETESPRNPRATTRAILAMCDDVRHRLGVSYPGE